MEPAQAQAGPPWSAKESAEKLGQAGAPAEERAQAVVPAEERAQAVVLVEELKPVGGPRRVPGLAGPGESVMGLARESAEPRAPERVRAEELESGGPLAPARGQVEELE